MNVNMELLQAGLKDFGLNPADWILESQNRIGNLFQLCVRHQRDRELFLKGWAVRESWLTLSYQG